MLMGGAAVFIVAIIGGWLLLAGRSGCTDRADAEARVAAVTAALQESAASGKITTQELAARIVRVNSAATAYEQTKDDTTFCETLNTLDAEFKEAQ